MHRGFYLPSVASRVHWVTYVEATRKSPAFLGQVARHGLRYCAEVPPDTRFWKTLSCAWLREAAGGCTTILL